MEFVNLGLVQRGVDYGSALSQKSLDPLVREVESKLTPIYNLLQEGESDVGFLEEKLPEVNWLLQKLTNALPSRYKGENSPYEALIEQCQLVKDGILQKVRQSQAAEKVSQITTKRRLELERPSQEIIVAEKTEFSPSNCLIPPFLGQSRKLIPHLVSQSLPRSSSFDTLSPPPVPKQNISAFVFSTPPRKKGGTPGLIGFGISSSVFESSPIGGRQNPVNSSSHIQTVEPSTPIEIKELMAPQINGLPSEHVDLPIEFEKTLLEPKQECFLEKMDVCAGDRELLVRFAFELEEFSSGLPSHLYQMGFSLYTECWRRIYMMDFESLFGQIRSQLDQEIVPGPMRALNQKLSEIQESAMLPEVKKNLLQEFFQLKTEYVSFFKEKIIQALKADPAILHPFLNRCEDGDEEMMHIRECVSQLGGVFEEVFPRG